MLSVSWRKGVPVAFGCLLVALFAGLGLWQLQRAEYKQTVVERFEQALDQPVEVMDRYRPRPRHTPVELAGRFVEPVIFLDNQLHQGRLGVHVFAPFRPAWGEPLVLVNLGWQPVGPRRELPRIELPAGRQQQTGLLGDPPPVGIRLGDPDLDSPPHRVPYLDLGQLAEQLNLRLAPQILLATGEDPDYVRDWRPAIAMPPERHRAYAFQWFALAAAVAVLIGYGLWRIKKRK